MTRYFLVENFVAPNPTLAGVVAASLPVETTKEHFSVSIPNADNHFVPNDDWLQGWKKFLPLDPILRTLQVLVPQVESLCAEKSDTGEVEILEFLQVLPWFIISFQSHCN